jgi:hypothetical protein
VWGQETKTKEEEQQGDGQGSGAAAEQQQQQQQQQPQRGSRSGSDALVGGGSSGGGDAASQDLLGLDVLGSSPPPAAPPPPAPAAPDALRVPVTRTISLDPSAKERMPLLLAAASARVSGALYEDAFIQVGVKKAIAGAEGTLTLFLGNRTSPAIPLVGLKLRIPEHAGVECVLGEVPTTILPGAQLKVSVTCTAKAPFVDPPQLQLSFISSPGTGHAYPLLLPLAPANFFAPAALPPEAFKKKWGDLNIPPKALTAAYRAKEGAEVTLEAAGAALTGHLKLAQCEVMPTAASGAGVFKTTTLGPTGAPVAVGVLVMIIPDAAAGVFKCAVRTTLETVTKSIMGTLQTLLES